MTKAEKTKALEELNKEIAADTALPLREAATNSVPGEGNSNADILFVGEAPGAKEDELGRPFVGAAGKLLDELIASIGLSRDTVFIANLIKHRPPGNRDPLPVEIKAYVPYLEKQLAIIQPKLIATLGRYSLQYFLGETQTISKIHGQPKRNKRGQIVVPMYHPAAALYSGSLRPTLFSDFAKIPKVLEIIKSGKAIAETDKREQEADSEQTPAIQQQTLL